MKTLLIDYTTFEISPAMVLESEQKNNGKVIVTGVIQRAEAPNQNGRVYPKRILEREVIKYIGREIKENRALGELDHPESSVVNLKNVSHIFRNIWWEGNDVIGKVEVLSTPSGNILRELLKSQVALGISSRGMGSVEATGRQDTVTVKDDFDLVCWDFVSNPSTHGAFMAPNGISESVVSSATDRYLKINTLVSDILCELTCQCSIPTSTK